MGGAKHLITNLSHQQPARVLFCLAERVGLRGIEERSFSFPGLVNVRCVPAVGTCRRGSTQA